MFDIGSLFTAFVVFEWVIRLIMLFVVPNKQRTSTASAWLLLIMIMPVIGSLLYFMFGNPNLPRYRRERLKTVNALTKKELTELEASHPTLFAALKNDDHRSIAALATRLGGLPPMTGNAVSFSYDYDTIFSELASAIDEAKEYVHIVFFIAALDESTQPVFDAMKRATQRGVTLRFMYDRVLTDRHHSSGKMREYLSRAGVEVREMLPLSLWPGRNFTRPDLRNHRKVVIIDGQVAFTGSQNLIDKRYRRKDNLHYEDLMARLEGPVVWQLNNVFRADWYAETEEPLLDVVEDVDVPKKTGGVIAQVLPSGPNHKHDNNLKMYTSMVHAAKRRVHIVVPYFIPDDSLLGALTTAAQRGVEVTIVNSEVIDKMLAGHAQRSYYDELLEVGVNIYLYKKPAFLHAKYVIVDDEVAIFGSSNLDIRSFELDFELNTIVYDKTVVSRLDDIEREFVKKSTRISPDVWAQRPLRLKLLDRFARLASALL